MYKVFVSLPTGCDRFAIIIIVIIIRVSLHVHFLVLIHKTVKYLFVRSVCKEGLRYAVLTSYLIHRRTYTYSQSSVLHQQIAKICAHKEQRD